VSWSLSTKMPWRGEDGSIIGTFGISRDITALKKAEAELENTHKRLVEASRLAGMTEVASDVLHNVGNALNSINVSCALVADRVGQRSFANVASVSGLLRNNTGHLDRFLSADPKGRLIPEFLEAAAETFEEDKAFLVEELERLRKHIEHVNRIVAMQQSYAKVAGVEENIELGQSVEDALQINGAGLDRHGIELCRQIETVPPVLVDKHKVLQILVNLISNAKYALSQAKRADKLLTIRVAARGANHVCVEIKDNGVGIPPENLTRIFAHGFTTRRNGHGFGLHSGALAAKELGGALSVQSEGANQGAVFTLTLPVRPARHPQK
jgi:C4-dicarboxylate-specific signal transduction histidine kinase